MKKPWLRRRCLKVVAFASLVFFLTTSLSLSVFKFDLDANANLAFRMAGEINKHIHIQSNDSQKIGNHSEHIGMKGKDSQNAHKIVKRNTGEKLYMVLFSSWASKEEKNRVYDNTLANWQSFLPDIQPLVFANDVKVQQSAGERSWHHLPELSNPRCGGPPLLPPMFLNASDYYDAYFYGFANADILFSDNLKATLDFFIRQWHQWDRPIIIIGRRTNYDLYKHETYSISKREVEEKVTELEEVPKSTDYFFTTRDFPWWNVAPLSIGRPAFCRWIMGYAHKIGAHVIDATETVAALHLTTEDGNKSSWNLVGKGMHCNEDVIEKREVTETVRLALGWVECALLETYMDDGNHVQLRSRNATDINCPVP